MQVGVFLPDFICAEVVESAQERELISLSNSTRLSVALNMPSEQSSPPFLREFLISLRTETTCLVSGLAAFDDRDNLS